jgi:membrane associated rhomboid family serine protease
VNPYRHLSILTIIAVAAMVFVAEQTQQTTFSRDGGVIPTQVRSVVAGVVDGQFTFQTAKTAATFVTHMFLHGDVQHILYNLVFLWTFGILASDLLGQWRALAVFLLCGIGGAIGHICLNLDSSDPMIGASGAISGLEGLYLGLAVRWSLPYAEVWPIAYPVHPQQLGLFAILGFVGDLLLFANHDEHIAYGAHLGGFLTGVAIAAVITTAYPTLTAYERAGSRVP